jgi:hypothetical protein
MLDSPAVPASLLAVLEDLNVFTAPSFATFTAMVTGLVAKTRAGTVTGMLTSRPRSPPGCRPTPCCSTSPRRPPAGVAVPGSKATASACRPIWRRPRRSRLRRSTVRPHRHGARRTVPFGLYCYSITVIWYALHGHHPADAADRREQAHAGLDHAA